MQAELRALESLKRLAEEQAWPEMDARRRDARPNQLPPETNDWMVQLWLAGRGFGKTFALTMWAALQAEVVNPGHGGVLIGTTFGDVREVLVEGPSGILDVLGDRLVNYNRSTYEIHTRSGSTIYMRSADQPDRLRGLNLAWAACDELASWRYPDKLWSEALIPALRVGSLPRVAIATTPKPTSLIKQLVDQAKEPDGGVHLTTGSTFDNAANLSDAALKEMKRRYEGTSLGRQELYGELILEVIGALWNLDNLDEHRIEKDPSEKWVVAVDPSISETGDESGVVVAGSWKTPDHTLHVGAVADYTVPTGIPLQWAQAAVTAYKKHDCDCIVAEKNQGGLMVESTIRQIDAAVPVKLVWASKGKATRAQPVAMLHEQGRGHIIGRLPELEDQLVSWVEGSSSPDRLDAYTYAALYLMEQDRPPSSLGGYSMPTGGGTGGLRLPAKGIPASGRR